MRKALVYVVAAVAVLMAVLAVGTGTAAASTTVEQFSDGPFPEEFCGVSGTISLHGTLVFRDDGTGSGTFWLVFTAENGKSFTQSYAGPTTFTEQIDEQAGTVTYVITTIGLGKRVSVTNGPTLIVDAGTVTVTEVYEYTGDPDDPAGEQISDPTYSGMHGPHSILLEGSELVCELLHPYLSGS